MDFAPNNTARLKVHYFVGLRSHVQTIRYNSTGPLLPQEVAAEVAELWAAVSPIMFNDLRILSAEVAPENSDVFLPVSSTFITVTPSGNAANMGDSPQFMTIPGKSQFGNAALLMWFGVSAGGDSSTPALNDYRITVADYPLLGPVFSVLNDGTSPIRAIDGQGVFWQQYANLGYHSHYQRKARG